MQKRSTVDLAHPRDPVLRDFFAGGMQNGAPTTERGAMSDSAVHACVNILSETIGAMPLHLYRRDDDRRELAEQHPAYRLVNRQPNDFMTALEWREWLVQGVALRGDAFTEVEQRGDGKPSALVPLMFDHVTPRRSGGAMRYEYRPPSGRGRILDPSQCLRVPHKLQADGSSLSPLQLHARTFALSRAGLDHQASVYQNGAAPKGAIKVPTHLSDEAVASLRASWERRHKGPENAGRMAILDGGLEWQSIGVPNKDLQFIEMMQLTRGDIARIYRVPPHKIGDLDRATFSNIEHQSIEFVTDTILPWARRIENRLDMTLLSDAEQRRYFFAFDLRGLLRGDSKARAEYYRSLFYLGSISPNEIRRIEGMDPIAGGDAYYLQGATIKSDALDGTIRDVAANAGEVPGGATDENVAAAGSGGSADSDGREETA